MELRVLFLKDLRLQVGRLRVYSLSEISSAENHKLPFNLLPGTRRQFKIPKPVERNDSLLM